MTNAGIFDVPFPIWLHNNSKRIFGESQHWASQTRPRIETEQQQTNEQNGGNNRRSLFRRGLL